VQPDEPYCVFLERRIVLRLESTGVAVYYVDEYQYRCLLHHFEASITAIKMRQHEGHADEIDDIRSTYYPELASNPRARGCTDAERGRIVRFK
jgi:hypothetical protein